jgi:High potential iron-sulfur protein
MMDKRDTSFPATRRGLLQGAFAGLSFLRLSMSTAHAAKASLGSVGYRGSPKGDQNCANCKLFVSPNACKSVSGEVSANGWCRIWKA